MFASKRANAPNATHEDKEYDLGHKFNEIVKVDTSYGKIYGANHEYYKVGVQDGLDKEEIDMIKKNLGYSLYGVSVGNEHFVNAIFKKSK